MTKREILLAAYDELEEITPKSYDCGLICGGTCCKENDSHGADEPCGMTLLPGEDELLKNENGFSISTSGGLPTLFCGGNCERESRPFACRIFPFYPKITKTPGGRYIIEILRDPRAMRLCPIVCDFRSRAANVYFLRHARRAVRILLQDEDIAKALMEESELLTGITVMRSRLLGGNGGKADV